MAAITSLISGDNMLVMGNEQFIRPMTFGNNWNRVRICIRFCIYGSSNFVGGMGLGLCNGKQYFASDSDMVYYAIATDSTLGPLVAWGRTTSNRFYFSSIGGHFACAKVGNTTYQGTGGTNNLGSPVYFGQGAYPLRYMIAADFTRSGSSFSLTAWGVSNTSAVPAFTDQDQGSFFYNLENPTPVGLGSTYTPTGPTGYTGGSGLLNSVWLAWRTTTPVLLVSDLAVCRYA
jgi:hypothetical protein